MAGTRNLLTETHIIDFSILKKVAHTPASGHTYENKHLF
jgi:hypothetical protein